MDKFWLESYEAGVPAEIDWTQYRSLTHLLEEAFRKYADRKAYACMGKSMTFAELDRMSQQMAAWLQSRGLQPGARVAIMLPNVLQYPVAMAAVLRAGYTIVNVNPLYTAARAAAPAERLGRRSHRGAGELRPHGGRRWSRRPRSSTSSSPPWATCWARRA
jgi:non-ribosomal peptide synthetase component E (peptide arylation enzyme)